eukprot:TRINITY_DN24816_c0_g1_i1.p1 TRINITY_DN24816_c0_g1~~TRINITY_DN24816_c0_g1_i1.p1  ORF type:complete len:416 (-),score=101.67 TRINITY_DN24816_c0_g1_i1:107-1354(-)
MKDILFQLCLFLFPLGIVLAQQECCSSIVLDVEDPESDVHILQGSRLGFYTQIGQYGEKAQYKQVDGDNYIFYSETELMWITTPVHVGSTSTGITSKSTANCADSISDWAYFNGTTWQYNRNLKSSCAKIEDICCSNIEMSSPAGNNTKDNSSSLVYAEESRKTLGRYIAVGMTNGRYIYQHDDMDRYLEFDESNQNWLIVHEVGCTSGFIYHSGGSVCPEHSGSRWHTAAHDQEKNTTGWAHDPDFTVKCVEQNSKKASEESSSKKVITKLDTKAKANAKSTTTTKAISKEGTMETEKTTSSIITTSPTTELVTNNVTVMPHNHSMTTSTTSNKNPTTETTPAEKNLDNPQANPLISKADDSGSSVTPIVVSLLIIVVFVVLGVIFVRRFRKYWRSGSHGRQLVMETIGLYRDV